MITKSSIILLLTIILSSKCEGLLYERTEFIWLENKSNIRIYASIGIGENNGGMNIYPDTSLPEKKPSLLETNVREKGVLTAAYSISSIFEQTLSNHLLSVYIFDADLVDALGWEEIRKQKQVLQRLDLSQEDLERIHYTITYP